MKATYANMVKLIAASNCYSAGAKVPDIAKSAKVSVSAVYRWLRITRTLRR